jgi:hypothetical protein
MAPAQPDTLFAHRPGIRRWLAPDGDAYFKVLWGIALLSCMHFAGSLLWWGMVFWIALWPDLNLGSLCSLPAILHLQPCVPYVLFALFLLALRLSATGNRWAEAVVMGGLLLAAVEFLIEVRFGLAQIHYFGDPAVVNNNFYATWWVYSCGPAWHERNLVIAASAMLLAAGILIRVLAMRRRQLASIGRMQPRTNGRRWRWTA